MLLKIGIPTKVLRIAAAHPPGLRVEWTLEGVVSKLDE
jgi:hypothetical protein